MEDKTDLINAQKGKNKGNVIKSITYSSDLSYDQERDGKVSDLVLSQPMTQVEWGRDKDNYPVYYDEQVVGEIIAFESQRYNLMAKGDEKVLSLIDDSTNLYQDTAALKNQQPAGEFSKLEIGEIRQAGSKILRVGEGDRGWHLHRTRICHVPAEEVYHENVCCLRCVEDSKRRVSV